MEVRATTNPDFSSGEGPAAGDAAIVLALRLHSSEAAATQASSASASPIGELTTPAPGSPPHLGNEQLRRVLKNSLAQPERDST